jgi:hypothetical protein
MSEQARECWDCGGTEFELVGGDSEIVAVCVDCSAGFKPALTYIPDENGRDHYEVSA